MKYSLAAVWVLTVFFLFFVFNYVLSSRYGAFLSALIR